MESLFTLILAHPLAKYVVVLVVYVSFVRHQRYRRIKALLHKYPDPEIPLRDLDVATEVLSAVRDYEFPFTYGNGLEISLLSTYGIPSISAILAATGQFKCGYLKRSVDGTLLLQELNEGYSRNQLRTALDKGRKPDKNEIENDRLRAAIAMERINFFHRQYNIKQSDYLYTLALFAVGPFLWIDRFEWRKSTDLEKNASLALWAAQGEKMGIQNIPKTFEDFVALVEEYEREYMVYAKSNTVIAEAFTKHYLTQYSSPYHEFVRQILAALFSDRLRGAFKAASASWKIKWIIHSFMWLRALVLQNFMLPRKYPQVQTALRANKDGKYVPRFNVFEALYPQGYNIEDLGPEKFLGKNPASLESLKSKKRS